VNNHLFISMMGHSESGGLTHSYVQACLPQEAEPSGGCRPPASHLLFLSSHSPPGWALLLFVLGLLWSGRSHSLHSMESLLFTTAGVPGLLLFSSSLQCSFLCWVPRAH
jgi:hypothetical protein